MKIMTHVFLMAVGALSQGACASSVNSESGDGDGTRDDDCVESCVPQDTGCTQSECFVDDEGKGGAGSEAATGGSASGGNASGGSASGGAGSGGDNSGEGSGGSNNEGSSLAAQYPCDGSTAAYDVVMSGSGDNWTITGEGNEQTISTGMEAALGAAYARLSGSAGSKAKLLVQGSGSISASSQLKMPSHMLLNVCGTIDVTGSPSGSDRSPLYARSRENIAIPHVSISGNAQYGMFFRDVKDLHLGDVYINGTSGLGIRIDSNGSNDRSNATNIKLDYVHVENTGGHGVEFYGVDGIEIGTVVARRTGDCGLILNKSINANIGLVDAIDAAHVGTGYAAFRTANNNGQYDDGSYPTNIRLGELRASGSEAGRGFFCVSQSGGVEISQFSIEQGEGSPVIFIENCYNVNLASASGAGTVKGGRVYVGHNAGNGEAARDVTFRNITLSEGAYIETNGATCGRNNQAINVSGGSVDVCQ